MGTISSQDLRDIVLCAVSWGLRLGELLALSCSDVDFTRRVLTVQYSGRFTTKNKRMRVILMNDGVIGTVLQVGMHKTVYPSLQYRSSKGVPARV